MGAPNYSGFNRFTFVSAHSDQIPPKRIRVYLVDDHSLFRSGLRAAIEMQPDMAVCGDTDDPSVALAELRKLDAHVVLVDISLRGCSGLEVIQRIRTSHPSIKTIAISMHPEKMYLERVLNAGARGFIEKAGDFSRVYSAIRKVAQGRMAVTANVHAEVKRNELHAVVSEDETVSLSYSERVLARLIGRGYGARQIAAEMKLSMHEVEEMRRKLGERLKLSPRELMNFCARLVFSDGGTDPVASGEAV